MKKCKKREIKMKIVEVYKNKYQKTSKYNNGIYFQIIKVVHSQ